jgi:CxxC-x17-CxxC domain-containing protein
MKNSFFGYNHTTASLYYPLAKEEAQKCGARWSDYEPPPPKVEKVIPADRLPDNIDDIPDDVLNWAITCEVTGKPFIITQQELRLYRQMRVPLPRRNWQQRQLERFNKRNPRKLFERKCDKCGKDIKTTYSPERPEIVYCEDCYHKEVYV